MRQQTDQIALDVVLLGHPVTFEDLPDPETRRWVVARKAVVVAAVEVGLIEVEDALERYSISAEEYESWKKGMLKHGLRGLRVTRLQDYRGRSPAADRHDSARPGEGVAA